jgi:3-hydroxyacyl-CoA dehydrogenase
VVDRIKTVTVLGASGTVGSLTGGIIAQSGEKVYFLSRTEDGAKRGLERAIDQARSEVIARHIICGDYEQLFETALKESDWIIEAVTENLAVKQQIYQKLEGCKQPGAVVSSTTSSLPLSALVLGRSRDFRRNFLSTHFYNPPGRMPACEITGHDETDPAVLDFMKHFLEKELGRVVIPVRNVAGFAGNRIAFVLFSRITALAKEYGVEMMDYLIGPYTGRLMPPLATLDLVGLDIHKAIINSLYENTCDEMHDWLLVPDYINAMIAKKLLGNKTRGGFYRKLEDGRFLYLDPQTCDYTPAIQPHIGFVEEAKHLIRMGMYREAFDTIRTAHCHEADIVMDILCAYIAYSYACIGEVTDLQFGIDGIDRVMSSGFHWAPPSVIVEMLGGKEAVAELLAKKGFAVPATLKSEHTPAMKAIGAGKYFVAK